MFKNELTSTIAGFLIEIGIDVKPGKIEVKTFFPGMYIDRGAITVDESILKNPGDILHEAGHLAVLMPEERKVVVGNAGKTGGQEIMTIAWSYAACIHLGLDTAVVFNDDGFSGESPSLIENFGNGRYIGVPGLQRFGMTLDSKQAAELGRESFPKMTRWLR